ncbi:aromatic ring-hydroxylating dioxygenase subunit alpha [Novosphingobium humi]|uniref:aromatic ring-hydroxylating dioxygenase subunit alpha n=1 Tax=Novosphingobium humi TaxID=2282397 RepID=UPI0025B1119E|nr:aromatic ring-hydroxylating dioxygenase subunit alpha [Novosphingobium humi]WJT00655.1 aromatic ring-hydroxylating dioxygenase subunit alpha [Novosphingobium humi]
MTSPTYPLTVDQPYPRNQWWVAAYAAEVGRDLLARDILGERVLLYRTEAGEAVALSGICPHRAFPLEMGRLVGDHVQCGYHGFTFGADGGCVLVPSQSGVPQKSSLRRYPVAEQGDLVWIWTGQADLADPALLPDLGAVGLGRPDWASEQHPVCEVAARYTLLIENLLDLSHVTFIHAATIPGGEKVAQIPVAVIETDHSLTVRRKGENLPLNPLLKMQFPDQDGPVHQHFDAEYLGPAMIRTGGAVHDAASGRRLGTCNFLHMITPAGPTSLRYFVITARDFGLDNPALGQINLGMGTRIQPEDSAAIAAIEQVFQSGVTLPSEISARVDNGALKVRRRLEAQIRAEQAMHSAAAAR